MKKSHTWRTESCHTAEWIAVCHTFSGLDHANKFTIFILLLPHVSTQRKNEKKEKIEKKIEKKKKGKKRAIFSTRKQEGRTDDFVSSLTFLLVAEARPSVQLALSSLSLTVYWLSLHLVTLFDIWLPVCTYLRAICAYYTFLTVIAFYWFIKIKWSEMRKYFVSMFPSLHREAARCKRASV